MAQAAVGEQEGVDAFLPIHSRDLAQRIPP